MATVADALAPEYGWVALVLVAIGAQVLVHGIPIGILRKRVFGVNSKMRKTKEYQALEEDHKKAFDTPVHYEGYPDMGNGKFGALLEYKGAFAIPCRRAIPLMRTLDLPAHAQSGLTLPTPSAPTRTTSRAPPPL